MGRLSSAKITKNMCGKMPGRETIAVRTRLQGPRLLRLPRAAPATQLPPRHQPPGYRTDSKSSGQTFSGSRDAAYRRRSVPDRGSGEIPRPADLVVWANLRQRSITSRVTELQEPKSGLHVREGNDDRLRASRSEKRPGIVLWWCGDGRPGHGAQPGDVNRDPPRSSRVRRFISLSARAPEGWIRSSQP
jgi:hypothetical protein